MKIFWLCGFFLALTGCAAMQTPFDYANFHAHRPRSILVLPPVSQATDIRATYGYLSTVTAAIAEKGYYVFPVAVVDQLMKENGLPNADEMQKVSLEKINEIIAPDAVLYLEILKYGTKYILVDSVTEVSVYGKLVDAHSGTVLWEGRSWVTKSSGEGQHSLAGVIATAMVSQIANSTADSAHALSRQANYDLFYRQNQGLLAGPYLRN